MFECEAFSNLSDIDKLTALELILVGEKPQVIAYFCALGVDIQFIRVRGEILTVASNDHSNHHHLFKILRALWRDIHEFCPHVYHTKIEYINNILTLKERC